MKTEKIIQNRQPDEDVYQFFVSAYSSDIDLLSKQLAKGVDVNSINDTQQTALHLTQNTKFARLLIEHGANVNARNDFGQTPLFNKEVAMATLLLDAGADINAISDAGNTALLWYTYSGYLDGIKLLVSKGADINICNIDHNNAVNIAEHFHHDSELLKYLDKLHIAKCAKQEAD